MSRYQPYPSYKDSGIEWLGEVPKDWETQRIKFLFHIGRGRVISQEELIDEGNYPVYSSQTKNNGCLGYIETYDFDCQQITWTTDGANAGTVFLREGKHNCTNVCGTLQAKNNEYNINFITSALQHATQFYKRPDTNGAKIMNGEMAEIFVTLPSVSEQTTIANFLDIQTAKIDTLIAKQQRMIELLGEKRSALISHTITKGLDLHVKMKDSGVEWLGEVPEHWEISKIGFLSSKIGSGKTPRGGSEVYADEGIVFIRSQNVYDEGLRLDDVVFISKEIDEEMANTRVKAGDILLNVTGASIGRTTLVPYDFDVANVNQHVCIIRISSIEMRPYIALVMKSATAKTQIDAFQNGAAREGLNFEQIANIQIALPPLLEQIAITGYIDTKTAKIDALIAKARQAIELMKERRTALISAAVTGKIDVREAV